MFPSQRYKFWRAVLRPVARGEVLVFVSKAVLTRAGRCVFVARYPVLADRPHGFGVFFDVAVPVGCVARDAAGRTVEAVASECLRLQEHPGQEINCSVWRDDRTPVDVRVQGRWALDLSSLRVEEVVLERDLVPEVVLCEEPAVRPRQN